MFCQKCGAELSDALKFCVKCGHRLKIEPRISNKAMLIAGIAAAVSVGVALLGFLPRSEPIKAQGEPSPTIIVPSPSPRASPTQKLRLTFEPPLEPTPRLQRPRPGPTLDYPYRYRPTLLSPDDGALFSYRYSLGRLTLRWKRGVASEIDGYKVTIEYGNPSHLPPWIEREFETPWDYHTIEFAGTQVVDFSGRWRVTPIFADGRTGDPSEWRTFQFTR